MTTVNDTLSALPTPITEFTIIVDTITGPKKITYKDRILTVSDEKPLPTCTTDSFGNKYWRLDGKLHRTDGPAIEYASGDKHWYLDGKEHRTDGPAMEKYQDGKLILIEKWINGEKISSMEF